MVAGIVARAESVVGVIVAPAGWTEQVGVNDDTVGHNSKLYTRVASSEPANYTWTTSVGRSIAIAITTWDNVKTAAPVEASAATTDGILDTTVSSGGVGTINAGSVVVTVYATSGGVPATSHPLTVHINTIKRAEATTTVTAVGHGIMQASEYRSAPGATGTRDAVTAATNVRSTALTVVLTDEVIAGSGSVTIPFFASLYRRIGRR